MLTSKLFCLRLFEFLKNTACSMDSAFTLLSNELQKATEQEKNSPK